MGINSFVQVRTSDYQAAKVNCPQDKLDIWIIRINS